MLIKKESYMFSKYHGDRLKRALLDRSFAFNFNSFESYFMSETTGIKEAGKVTKITFSKNLLPGHCKLAVVADALASLEMFPNNVQLLETFSEYVENNPAERRAYPFISGVKWGLLVACIVADVPLILLVAACALILSSIFSFNYLEKKLGLWIGKLSAAHRSPFDLEVLEATLLSLIDHCKTAENIQEAAYKKIQFANTYPSAPPPYSFFSHYPELVSDHQDPENNAYDGVREYPQYST